MEAPWVEKYRPEELANITGNRFILERLKGMTDRSHITNIIMTGPPGTGKTSAAVCLAKKVLGEDYSTHLLQINASDNRCIEVIRKTIMLFAQKKSTENIKIIILDEIDAMTETAQQGLRRILDIYYKSTKFILVCNMSNKVIEPLQSRSCIFRFKALNKDDVMHRLRYICSKENITYTESGLETIIYTASGDMRIALNNLQSTFHGFNKITKQNVLMICHLPCPDIILKIVHDCSFGKISNAMVIMRDLWKTGYAPNDILLSFFSTLQMNCNDLPNELKLKFLHKLAEIHIRVDKGCCSLLQLSGLCSDLCMISKGLI